MSDDHVSRVQADEFQFLIAETGANELLLDGGLVGGVISHTAPDWLSVTTGAHWGPVEVQSIAHASEPELRDEWDDVVETSVRCDAGLQIVELLIARGRSPVYASNEANACSSHRTVAVTTATTIDVFCEES